MSTAAGVLWEGPVMRTRDGTRVCDFSASQEPVSFGNLGVFSYKTPLLLLEYFFGVTLRYIPLKYISRVYILGRIDLRGHVIEHELGYRAQEAVVRELWVQSVEGKPRDDVIAQFEERYQCPVHSIEPKQVPHWARYYSEEEAA